MCAVLETSWRFPQRVPLRGVHGEGECLRAVAVHPNGPAPWAAETGETMQVVSTEVPTWDQFQALCRRVWALEHPAPIRIRRMRQPAVVKGASKPLRCRCGRSFALPMHLARHKSTQHAA